MIKYITETRANIIRFIYNYIGVVGRGIWWSFKRHRECNRRLYNIFHTFYIFIFM